MKDTRFKLASYLENEDDYEDGVHLYVHLYLCSHCYNYQLKYRIMFFPLVQWFPRIEFNTINLQK